MRLLRATPPAARAGFTLAEVLVTILITGLLMVAITEILTAARHTRDSIQNTQERQLAGPAILDRVEADLRGLTTYNRPPGTVLRVKDRVLVGLDADSLDFVTTQNGLVSEEDVDWLFTDMTEVGYRLRPNPLDNDFLEIYRRQSFGVDEEPFEGGLYTFLHDRVVAFDVQVFEEDGPEAEPLDEWNADDREPKPLPRRLEITLILELSPRLVKEQLEILPDYKRRMEYRRILRFPDMMFLAQQIEPVPMVPDIQPPTPDDAGLGAEGLTGDGGGGAGGGLPGGPDLPTGGGGGPSDRSR